MGDSTLILKKLLLIMALLLLLQHVAAPVSAAATFNGWKVASAEDCCECGMGIPALLELGLLVLEFVARVDMLSTAGTPLSAAQSRVSASRNKLESWAHRMYHAGGIELAKLTPLVLL
jgi:hypothetical protein